MTNIIELKSFLSLCKVFWRSAPYFAQIANHVRIQWRAAEIEGISDWWGLRAIRLKQENFIPPFLSFEKTKLPKDAGYRRQRPANLMHKNARKIICAEKSARRLVPITYGSLKTILQQKSSTFLSFWAVLILILYLEGTWCTIQADSKTIQWILKLTDAPVQLWKKRFYLSQLEFYLVHRAETETEKQGADAQCCWRPQGPTTLQ